MNTSARTLDFFDGHVCALICERYGYTPADALRQFTGSQTCAMLADEDLKLWHFSPVGVFGHVGKRAGHWRPPKLRVFAGMTHGQRS